jgi:carbonyl reductase 1
LTLYATSRKGEKLGYQCSNDQKIHYPKLDISDVSSIASFASDIKAAGQLVDVLINNAGINLDNDFSLENATITVDINYRGTLEMCKAFIPLLRKDTGRIVNLSSVESSLNTWKPQMADKVRKIDSLHELEILVQSYLSHVEINRVVEAGFPPDRSYGVSKAAINVLTKVLADDNKGLTINCCCPGWIDTEMGDLVSTRKVKPLKTIEEGARIPMRLAFGDVQGISGRYWANGSVSSTEDGEPQEW